MAIAGETYRVEIARDESRAGGALGIKIAAYTGRVPAERTISTGTPVWAIVRSGMRIPITGKSEWLRTS